MSRTANSFGLRQSLHLDVDTCCSLAPVLDKTRTITKAIRHASCNVTTRTQRANQCCVSMETNASKEKLLGGLHPEKNVHRLQGAQNTTSDHKRHARRGE